MTGIKDRSNHSDFEFSYSTTPLANPNYTASLALS
jgi:hypothetical protein